MEAKELLNLIAGKAVELRQAGIKRLQLAEFCVVEFEHLEPIDSTPAIGFQADEEEEDISDPLRDPNTFPGGRMPRFNRGVDSD